MGAGPTAHPHHILWMQQVAGGLRRLSPVGLSGQWSGGPAQGGLGHSIRLVAYVRLSALMSGNKRMPAHTIRFIYYYFLFFTTVRSFP